MVLTNIMILNIISLRVYAILKVSPGVCSFTAFMGHNIEAVQ